LFQPFPLVGVDATKLLDFSADTRKLSGFDLCPDMHLGKCREILQRIPLPDTFFQRGHG
jgi:hypothetical protein